MPGLQRIASLPDDAVVARRPAALNAKEHGVNPAVKALLAIVAALCLGACSRSQPPPVTQTSAPTSKDPAAARELIARGAVVIDVRTAEEYLDEHLPRAINIPVQELPGRIGEIETLVAGDRTRPIVVYCAAGARAAKAKAQLDAAGYSSVVNGGGIGDLRAEDPR